MRNKINLTQKIILSSILLILLLITISAANAENLTVNLDDSGGINEAINTIEANSDINNTITLNPGTYNKTEDRRNNISCNDKNLIVQGNGSTDSVIIDAQNLGRMFTITGNSNITFINITFINGYVIRSAGGAIWDNGKGILNLINCTFKDNTASHAGAIYVNTTDIEVVNSKFINNVALDGNGGAIFNVHGKSFVTDSIFENNTSNSADGGAIYVGSDDIKITNSTFINNSAKDSSAGAVGSFDANIEVSNSTFINNSAEENGGAILSDFGIINVADSEFIGNIAGEDGGAIFVNYMANILRSNFTRNSQAIFINDENSNITSCNIINNSQGIYVSDISDKNTINYNRIFNNTEYDLNNAGDNTNANYNWWGNNTPTKIIGITPNNYFVMNVTNLTDLYSKGTVLFNYTFSLNTSEDAENSLLPYFITEVYTNLTNGVIESFDGRFSNKFNVTINNSGNVLYTFITDNEIQTLNGVINKLGDNSTINTQDGKVEKPMTISGVVKDERGTPLANIQITVTIDGKIYDAVTNANGEWSLVFTPDHGGKYDLVVSWTGNDTYNEFTNSTTFNVEKRNIIATLSVNENSDGSITITDYARYEDDNSPATNYPVKFYLDGKLVGSGTTNNDGIATLTIPANKVSSGIHVATIMMIGGDRANDSSSSIEFTKTTNDTNHTNQSNQINNISNNPITHAIMKETGIPINLIIIILLSLIGFGSYRKNKN